MRHLLRKGADAIHHLKVIAIIVKAVLACNLLIMAILLQYIHDFLTVFVRERLHHSFEARLLKGTSVVEHFSHAIISGRMKILATILHDDLVASEQGGKGGNDDTK